MTTKAPETDLPDRLRVYLQDVAATGGPVTYAEAARTLGLEGPQKIHRVAMALEQLMAWARQRQCQIIQAGGLPWWAKFTGWNSSVSIWKELADA